MFTKKKPVSIELSEPGTEQLLNTLSYSEFKGLDTTEIIICSPLGKMYFNNELIFRLPNRTGNVSIKVTALSKSGKYGMHSSTLFIHKTIECSIKVPIFIRKDDYLEVPLRIENKSK